MCCLSLDCLQFASFRRLEHIAQTSVQAEGALQFYPTSWGSLQEMRQIRQIQSSADLSKASYKPPALPQGAMTRCILALRGPEAAAAPLHVNTP